MADNKPNLSGIATDQWAADFDDMDAIMQEEQQRWIAEEERLKANPNTQTQHVPEIGVRTESSPYVPSAKPEDDSTAVDTNHPGYNNPSYAQPQTQTQQTQTQTTQVVVDPYQQEKEMLNGIQDGSTMDPNFKDSGTITPQQNPNQAQQAQQTQNPGQQNNDNNTQTQEDPYVLALKISKAIGTIAVPDDYDYKNLDAATLAMFKENTVQGYRQEALEFVRGRASRDEDMLRIFDYAMTGQEFANLPLMQEKLRARIAYSTFPLDTVENQKAIVELYLKDGLNPKDPRNEFVLNSIPAQLQQMEDDMRLKAEAVKAKAFFVDREEAEAREEEQRVAQENTRKQQMMQAEAARRDQWNQQFIETLNQSNWSEGKKEAVKQQASLVTLQDGNRVPLWQYKQEMIFDNPVLFQYFLDFMAMFDHTKGQFTGQAGQPSSEQEAVNTLLSRITAKVGDSASKGTAGNETPSNGQRPGPSIVDANNDWF
jgi:hypothetical protein